MTDWSTTIRIAIAFVFLFSSLGKLMNVRRFLESLKQYRLVPRRGQVILGTALLAAEASIGVLLVVATDGQLLLYLAASLFLMFAIVTGNELRYETETTCACLGGSARLTIDRWSVVLNILFALSATVTAIVSVAAPVHGITLMSGALIGALYWLIIYARSVLMLADSANRQTLSSFGEAR
jgi:hypothetical protein